MTSIVSGIYNRSLNLAKVAKEIVSDTYNSNSSAKDYIADIKDKLLHIDQVYLDASKKVTQEEEEQIKGKLEYRLLNFGTRKLVAAKQTAEAGIHKVAEAKDALCHQVADKKKEYRSKLDDKKNDVKALLITCKDKFSNTFEVKLRSAQTKVATFRSQSAVLAKSLTEQVKTRASSLRQSVASGFEKAVEKMHLQEYLDGVREKFVKLYNFTAQEAAQLKSNFAKLYSYLVDRVSSTDLVAFVKRNGERAATNFRAALSFLKETCVQNAYCLRSMGRNVSELAQGFTRKNGQLLSFMRAENKKLVNKFANKFEMEVYYTPTESVRLVDKLRGVAGWFAHRNGVNEAKEVFVADSHPKAD